MYNRRYTLYYINPLTYMLKGLLSSTIADLPVQCAENELAIFNPPPGQTCESYAGAYMNVAPGYLLNGDATSGCQYCPMENSNSYLQSVNVEWTGAKSWGYMGIFSLYTLISNVALVYILYWVTKVKFFSPTMMVKMTLKKIFSSKKE